MAVATRTAGRIESLLSARLFLNSQLADDRLYFVSDIAGRLSLYRMDAAGGVPEPLLPPGIALQNPELLGGYPFYVLPDLDRIVVMLDTDGDEVYQPCVIPLAGGFPEPLNEEVFGGARVHLVDVDGKTATGYVAAESREEAKITGLRVDLATGEAEELASGMHGPFPVAWTPDHTRAILGDGYTAGDIVLYERDPETGERSVLWGTLLEDRAEGETYPLLGLQSGHVTASGQGLLIGTSLFEDTFGPGYIAFDAPGVVEPVALEGAVHAGVGELERFQRIEGDQYLAVFNIDGVSWVYEAAFDETARAMTLGRVLVGKGELAGGVIHGIQHDPASGRYALSFCTATTPTQLYVIGAEGGAPTRLTNERPLGVDPALLSPGEDASYVSHDGLRVSARLYLPSPELGFDGPRPVVYYVHGGPQGQERPNFAWFSMPLIQILTLEGFAVFVPNARGSTGYGMDYMKRVDHDWGGLDRLDHVHA
jgi:hypothetical protein